MKTFFSMVHIAFLVLLFSVNANAQSLQPGDGIKIIFYNIPDQISGDYIIQEDGTVSLPHLGTIKAAGTDVVELKKSIYSKYATLYKNPELTVLQIIRVNIFGEVKNPGFYFVTGSDKLSDLIAQAGGTTPDADLGEISIYRNNREIQIDGEEVIEKSNKMDDIGLQSGDRIFISRKWFSGSTSTVVISTLAAITTIVAAIIYANNN